MIKINQLDNTKIQQHKCRTKTVTTKNLEQKPNISPSETISLIGGKGHMILLWGEFQPPKFPHLAKSRGPNSNTLAYAERALST